MKSFTSVLLFITLLLGIAASLPNYSMRNPRPRSPGLSESAIRQLTPRQNSTSTTIETRGSNSTSLERRLQGGHNEEDSYYKE